MYKRYSGVRVYYGDLAIVKLGVPLEGYLPLILPPYRPRPDVSSPGGLLIELCCARRRQAPSGPLRHLAVV